MDKDWPGQNPGLGLFSQRQAWRPGPRLFAGIALSSPDDDEDDGDGDDHDHGYGDDGDACKFSDNILRLECLLHLVKCDYPWIKEHGKYLLEGLDHKKVLAY